MQKAVDRFVLPPEGWKAISPPLVHLRLQLLDLRLQLRDSGAVLTLQDGGVSNLLAKSPFACRQMIASDNHCIAATIHKWTNPVSRTGRRLVTVAN